MHQEQREVHFGSASSLTLEGLGGNWMGKEEKRADLDILDSLGWALWKNSRSLRPILRWIEIMPSCVRNSAAMSWSYSWQVENKPLISERSLGVLRATYRHLGPLAPLSLNTGRAHQGCRWGLIIQLPNCLTWNSTNLAICGADCFLLVFFALKCWHLYVKFYCSEDYW